MVDISFIIKPIIGKLIGLISGSLIEKWKIKGKFKKIKDFRKEYEDTFVDSNSFQKFLNDEKNGLLIFNYVFGASYRSVTKVAFVEQLSKLATNEINNYRKSVHLEEINNHPIVNQYLNDLITYLEEYRDKSFKSNEMSIVSNIQNTIVENNKVLQEYFENNLLEIQERSYLEKFTDEYLEKILERNILDLGKRYISDANVKTDFNGLFDSLASNKRVFTKFRELLGTLQMSIKEFSSTFNKHIIDLGYNDGKFIDEFLHYRCLST